MKTYGPKEKTMEKNKILFVDDEPNVLNAYRRQFRKVFTIATAPGGPEGLALLKEEGPFAVVVSDLKMPGMSGIQFLTKVKEQSPDTVRMMLTGYADLQTAIEAVNEGNIFRFLTKPCPPDKLAAAIKEGLRQYNLVIAEKELLEETLRGSIRVLTELLSLLNPDAFGRSSRVKKLVMEIAEKFGLKDRWKLETAAMLSQIGCVILPEDVLKKVYLGKELTEEERQLYDMYPSLGHSLIKHIPRMEEIAEIIAYQEKNYDGTGIPLDQKKGEEIPLGARILKAALDFDSMLSAGFPPDVALARMKKTEEKYDPKILPILETLIAREPSITVYELSLDDLKADMILAEDLYTEDGVLLVSKGQEITWPMLTRLKNFARSKHIRQPVKVIIPTVD